MVRREVDSVGNIWYYNEIGELHQNGDLPAAIFKSGTIYYHKNGKRHRVCGPAIIYSHGGVEYCINGRFLNKEEFDNHPLVREYRLKCLMEGLLNG